MHDQKARTALSYVLIISWVILSAPQTRVQAAPEVWYGGTGSSNTIGRVTFDGQPLPGIHAIMCAQGMAVVGDEVWYGGIGSSNTIGRVTFDGQPLPGIPVGMYAEGICFVPEPATLSLLALGGLVLLHRRRRP